MSLCSLSLENKDIGKRLREKEMLKQHKNEGLKKRLPWFVPNNLRDTVEKQFILLKILFLSWRPPKMRHFSGYLPQLQKGLSQSRAQPTFSPVVNQCSSFKFDFTVFWSSFCLIIFTRASGNFCVCVSDTLKLRVIVIELTRLPDPPLLTTCTTHYFLMELFISLVEWLSLRPGLTWTQAAC